MRTKKGSATNGVSMDTPKTPGEDAGSHNGLTSHDMGALTTGTLRVRRVTCVLAYVGTLGSRAVDGRYNLSPIA